MSPSVKLTGGVCKSCVRKVATDELGQEKLGKEVGRCKKNKDYRN